MTIRVGSAVKVHFEISINEDIRRPNVTACGKRDFHPLHGSPQTLTKTDKHSETTCLNCLRAIELWPGVYKEES